MSAALPLTYAGVRIMSSPYAVKIVHRIGKHPIRKRRRGWTVVRAEVPCAYLMAGDIMVLHSSLYEQFKAASSAQQEEMGREP